ncbi:MAG: hypothetical protein A2233_05525 [Candidatus Kerfeldbacteria bacterium RIFOXYA2_FULL_38_24]|uniref:Uncharacterized protein n=1 Tax=Candidatus Kerfeldbacteria bacterium RIFOXYB2_FULL_38_14 TaxID=1798547 RepID=A0A1G2BHY3_9BACT|nr:MAG: hypothetical protein A2233_05525 [Candidatus Kerfeldbacteria bacterium RIFOXYA2_FULL_38_24]OGY88286.1 MAG: hypothetical protein A2319_03810 [Candidatus Kerfeldbacteria bacterium RIFOXYB2_FULL_38_14]OGY89739.1 MAG: hypothetical protein A2458_01620 [Candidatus Kerfeldbacteria bacterium RIFOXYC2_FULL_38_9]
MVYIKHSTDFVPGKNRDESVRPVPIKIQGRFLAIRWFFYGSLTAIIGFVVLGVYLYFQAQSFLTTL